VAVVLVVEPVAVSVVVPVFVVVSLVVPVVVSVAVSVVVPVFVVVSVDVPVVVVALVLERVVMGRTPARVARG